MVRVAKVVGSWYTETLPSIYWQQKGGSEVFHIIGFLMSVAASVAANYICKWLDRHEKD